MDRQTGRFRRADRLRRPWEFRRTSRQGRRTRSAAFVVLTAPTASPKGGSGEVRRLGLTVSRRVGNAVVRNRVKRATREWFRRERSTLPVDIDLLVIARRPAADLTPSEIGRSLTELAPQRTGQER